MIAEDHLITTHSALVLALLLLEVLTAHLRGRW